MIDQSQEFKGLLLEAVDEVESYLEQEESPGEEELYSKQGRCFYDPPKHVSLSEMRKGIQDGEQIYQQYIVSILLDLTRKNLRNIENLNAANAGDHFELWPFTFELFGHESCPFFFKEKVLPLWDDLGIYVEAYDADVLVIADNPAKESGRFDIRVRGNFFPEYRLNQWLDENRSLLESRLECGWNIYVEVEFFERREGWRKIGDVPEVEIMDMTYI